MLYTFMMILITEGPQNAEAQLKVDAAITNEILDYSQYVSYFTPNFLL